MSAALRWRRSVLTVSEAAKYFGRSERTIRLWCLDGTLLEFKYPVIRNVSGYVIVVPE